MGRIFYVFGKRSRPSGKLFIQVAGGLLFFARKIAFFVHFKYSIFQNYIPYYCEPRVRILSEEFSAYHFPNR